MSRGINAVFQCLVQLAVGEHLRTGTLAVHHCADSR